METTHRLGRARNARINQAARHASNLLATLKRLQGYRKDQHIDDKDAWFDARTDLETLVQSVHEANAYNNAAQLPEGEEVE